MIIGEHSISTLGRKQWKSRIAALPRGLSLHEVAAALNVTYQAAFYYCNLLGYRYVKNKPILLSTQAKVEKLHRFKQDLTVKQIAGRLKMTVSATRVFLERVGYGTIAKGYQWKVRPEVWQQVNWKRIDADIARELGVSRQLVHVKRLQLGRPIVPKKGR